jgi:ADP-ribose pyrophosphatase YjhB (NUDIX family)
VVERDGRVLLCRRAIEPRRGFWTLPSGYMENGETLAEGAAREAWEEAVARIDIDGILAVFSISRLGQVQVIFRARFAADSADPPYAAGEESLEVGLFAWDGIPWNEIAFPSAPRRWVPLPAIRPRTRAACGGLARRPCEAGPVRPGL